MSHAHCSTLHSNRETGTTCSSLWTAKSPPTGRHTRPPFTQRKRMLLPSFFFSPRTGGYRQIFLQGAPHSSSPVPSTSSVKQRDQLGPLISALTLRGFSQRLITAHLADQIVTYCMPVVDPVAAAARAFKDLSIEVCTADLTEAAPNRAACSSSQDMPAVAAAFGVLHPPDSLDPGAWFLELGSCLSSSLTSSYGTTGLRRTQTPRRPSSSPHLGLKMSD
jgi:hypothetical protein